jgi:hypothetical protein
MDAACLGKLARMQRERLGKPGFASAIFIIVYPYVRKLFKLVGFEEIWPTFDARRGAFGASARDDGPLEAAI